MPKLGHREPRAQVVAVVQRGVSFFLAQSKLLGRGRPADLGQQPGNLLRHQSYAVPLRPESARFERRPVHIVAGNAVPPAVKTITGIRASSCVVHGL